MTNVKPLLTPTDQERALIAMLHDLEARRLDKDESIPCYVMIKMACGNHDFNDEDDEDNIEKETIGWTVSLTLGGFHAEANGTTFAAAWDAMVREGDAEINQEEKRRERLGMEKVEKTLLSDVVRSWLDPTTPLTAQETELIMNLRRRAAKKDNYLIILAVNDETHPGEWEVTERKEACGSGSTFAAAWDERF